MCQPDSDLHPSALHTRSEALPFGIILVLTLLTALWLTLPYRRLDWVAFSQPYEPTPTATTTPTTPPASPLPDLVITRAGVSMRDYAGGCVTEFAPLVTRVCVQNQGAAPAGAFLVRADAYGGGTLEWTVGGLAAGVEQCLEREAAAFGQVMVDADNDVIESDETNNTAFVPIPTPPPICTPTLTFDYLPVIARNWVPAPTATPSAGPVPLLRISALQYSGRDEYIEILNESAAQNLTGWSILSVRGNQRYTFPDEYALGPDATVRVHSGPDAINNPSGDLLWTTDHIWNNDGDKAELYDSSERLIDSRCYNAGCP